MLCGGETLLGTQLLMKGLKGFTLSGIANLVNDPYRFWTVCKRPCQLVQKSALAPNTDVRILRG